MKKLFLALILAAAPFASQQAFSEEVCVEEVQSPDESPKEDELAQSKEEN